MTLHPVGPNPSVYVRPATDQDVGFLVDVVLVTARAAGPAWPTTSTRRRGARRSPPRPCARCDGEVAHDTTYVIEIDGERAGRLRLVRPPDFRELAGHPAAARPPGQGLGTHLIEQFLVDARDQGLPARLGVQRDNPRARAALRAASASSRWPPSTAPTTLADGDVRMEWRS